jgi:hypothetical protein
MPTLSLTQETRIPNALDDVTSNIWQAQGSGNVRARVRDARVEPGRAG